MSDGFYERVVSPQMGDTRISSKSQYALFDSVIDAVKSAHDKALQTENSINKIRYQNLALENSVRAYNANPNDMEGYKTTFRESLTGFPIPISRRHEYDAIASNTEARFFSPILGNRKQTEKTEERQQLSELADNLWNDGSEVLEGKLPASSDNCPSYVGDRYLESIKVLESVGEDGVPIFSPDEVSAKSDAYCLDALTSLATKEINSSANPVKATKEYVTGEKDFIAEIRTKYGPITLSSSELSAGAQDQLRKNIESAVVKTLTTKSKSESFTVGRNVMTLPASYRGTTQQKHGLDIWAAIQLESQPLSAENESTHIDNMINFSREFSYIPEPYVDLLSTNINAKGNPMIALSSSKLLTLALEQGGNRISKQFDDVTLLKSQLLSDLVWNGDVEPRVALDSINSIFHDPRSRDYAINLNTKLRSIGRRDRTNFYGSDIESGTYGIDGVGMYEDLVKDFYITNGGDSKSARKVAKARVEAIYSYPQYGHYKRNGWLFKTGGRKLKYQPGAYYGETIERHIDEEMKSDILPIVRDIFGYSDISHDNYFFVANELTADAFNSPTRDPIWEVWYVNNGGTRIQVTDETGNIFVYRVGDVVPTTAKPDKPNKSAMKYSRDVKALHEEMTESPEDRKATLMMKMLNESMRR